MKRLVVIGGSDAGISAALRARELDPSWLVQVVVADRYPNFSICGLPFFLSGETPRWQDLAHRTADDLRATGMELHLDTVAETIDPSAKTVRVRHADGSGETMPYDRLVVGTGAEPIEPPIAGLDLPGVYLLHSMAQSFAVHRHLEERSPERAVIVGGGYIGMEMADALRHRGLSVTLMDMAPTVLQTVDPALGTEVEQELAGHGVQVQTGAVVKRIEGSASGVTVIGDPDVRVEADLVIVAVGVRPATALGRTAGLKIGTGGAFRVNRRMETNLPGILAAGDCVETYHRLLPEPVYLPLGTTSHKQGRVAGAVAVGHDAEFAGSLGTQVVKVFRRVIGRTGLREEEAARAGFEPLTVETTVPDHKPYYPGSTSIRIRLTGDRASGRLLGAQMTGEYGAEVSKRIDVFAAAIFHGMNVSDVPDLDLSYTPPLGSPWDAVQVACMAWQQQAERDRIDGGQ